MNQNNILLCKKRYGAIYKPSYKPPNEYVLQNPFSFYQALIFKSNQ